MATTAGRDASRCQAQRVTGRVSRQCAACCVPVNSRDNAVATVVLAVDYGGRWDITQAARQLAARVQAGEMTVEDIDESSLSRAMALGDLPAPDLCIRTGGDARISNFMLWQFAYSELYFTQTLWPDFGELEFARALSDYARRERRFGLRESDALASGAQDA